MRNFIASAAATTLLLSAGAATAADLPSRSRAPVAAPIAYAPTFTWTGLYAGVNAGYAFGRFSDNNIGGRLFKDADGFAGGAQIGYNYQINQLVLGAEADFQAASIEGKPTIAGVGRVSKASIDYFGTVRARVGYAMGQTMIYGTGGWAYANAKIDTAPGVLLAGLSSDKNTHYGYAVGAGIEHALTNNVTVRGEYMYVDLEKKNYFTPGSKAGADFSLVRLGAAYKF